MSSHHIIRDDQEPALIIEYLDDQLLDQMKQLLGWSPKVLVHEQALGYYLQYGHKLDYALVSEAHKLFWEQELESQHPVELITFRNTSDEINPLEIFKQAGHKSVNILTSNELLDRCISQPNSLQIDLNLVFYTPSGRHPITHKTTYHKWLAAGSMLAITPLTKNIILTTHGFDQDFSQQLLNTRQDFKKSDDGNIVITLSQSPVMISEYWH